ncbi:MAG: AMP-binding protein [Rhizobiaceae bacterium]|nr:AMP-binding protein [Rhizobiaceae bacterium]
MAKHDDPRVPQAEDCVLRPLLERRAREQGEKVFATFVDGRPPLTYRVLRDRAVRVADRLHTLGVRQGDFVLIWLPNGEFVLDVMLAVNYLGATFVPINVAYKGRLLEHAVQVAGAKLMIGHPSLVPLLADVDRGSLETVVVASDDVAIDIPGLTVLPQSTLEGNASEPPPLERPIQPWDIQCVLYTSGTTGASKAVLSPYAHVSAMALSTFPFMTSDDRGVLYMPMFHIGGVSYVMWAILTGGSIAFFERFVTATFWRDVRETGGTFATILGAPSTFLLKAERGEDEENTPLRFGLMNPLTEEAKMLAKRVGFRAYGVFNMTETSTPLLTGLDPEETNLCGKPREGMECRVVDANDCEVAPGTVGELIVRSDAPWTLNAGYHKNPEATASAWRNGWFHTGDAFRRDDRGNFYFVDRLKDSIRRRGENISSAEVEFEVNSHPDVKETAAIAVTSEHTEDEVMVVVCPLEGRTVDPAALLAFLIPRMPHYMVPRFVRLVEDFPRTPTQRVQKHVLRSQGITEDTWDREKAGIVVKRDRL